MSEVEPKAFWETKILKWERARYSEWLRLYPLSWPIRKRLSDASAAVHRRLPAGGRVLELGCGSGYLAAALTDHCGAYRGVDLAEGAIAVARERVRAPGFEFHAGDAVSHSDGACDLTVFLGLTDWLDPAQLQNLFNGIRSKHILFSYTDVAFWNPYRLYRRLADPPHNPGSYRGRTYTHAQIAALLDENGFWFEYLTRPTLLNPGALIWASAMTHD